MIETNLTQLMISLVRGFSIARAAQSFGITKSIATKALEKDPLTADEYLKKAGDLASGASPKSIVGGVNQSITTVTEIQKEVDRLPTVNDSIKQETSTVSFAANNTTEFPFERQGTKATNATVLGDLAGQTGRKLNTSA